jgi:hypothetical protein
MWVTKAGSDNHFSYEPMSIVRVSEARSTTSNSEIPKQNGEAINFANFLFAPKTAEKRQAEGALSPERIKRVKVDDKGKGKERDDEYEDQIDRNDSDQDFTPGYRSQGR